MTMLLTAPIVQWFFVEKKNCSMVTDRNISHHLEKIEICHIILSRWTQVNIHLYISRHNQFVGMS
jgi:hypothetical protein